MNEDMIILDGVNYEPQEGETQEEYDARIDAEYYVLYGRHHPTDADLTPEMRAMVDKIKGRTKSSE